jgi:hypothetical protein
MRRTWSTGIILAAALALSGVAASSASAVIRCYKVDIGKGNFNAGCKEEVGALKGEWVLAEKIVKIELNLWCVKIFPVNSKTGEYQSGTCEVKEEDGEYTEAVIPECQAQAGTRFALCIESGGILELIEETAGFTDAKKSGTASLLEVPSLGAKIECEKAESSGTFEPTTGTLRVRKLFIIFKSGCKLVGLESVCKVMEPISTVAIEGTLTLSSTGTPTITFKPESGTEFASVAVTGSECEPKGTIKVQGTQACISPKVEEDSVEQTLECLKSGSKLQDGTKEAKLELIEIVKLNEPALGDKWSIIEGT